MIDVTAMIQAGRLVEAKALLAAYCDRNGHDAEARRLLARLVFQLGDAEAGLAHLEAVARTHGRLPELGFETGVMRLALARTEEAVQAFRDELAANPRHEGALFNLGWALRQTGRAQEAAAVFRRLVAGNPAHHDGWLNLGHLLFEAGDDEGAEQAFRKAAEGPVRLAALTNLSVTLSRAGRLTEAEDVLAQVLNADPTHAAAAGLLGNVMTAQGRLNDALTVFQRALAMRPDDPILLCNYALALKEASRPAEASDLLERAARLAPRDARVWNAMGVVAAARNRLDEAEMALCKAVALAPAMAEAHSNLGTVQGDRGRLTEALETFRRAHELRPDDPAIHSNLLFLMRHLPGIDPDLLATEHRSFGEIQESQVRAITVPAPSGCDGGRRLRIGYVSPDFCDHAVALFLAPVLAAHDRAGFEIVCYHTSSRTDAVTARLQANADHWRSVAGMPAAAAAALVRADGIDILVDLAGHSARNGLPIFVHKPAPIQATWLGYPGTTGLTRVDYRLTDLAADPPGRNDHLYTERLIYLEYQPSIRLPFTDVIPPPPPLLSNPGRPRFGSFNKPLKINETVLAVWADILKAVPDSTLLMVVPGGDDPGVRNEIAERFHPHGIDGRRIEVVGHRPLRQFLELVAGVDVALDPFPYSGGSTTMCTLWMGVPVVTLRGQDAASCVGDRLLATVGAEDLAAGDEAQYRDIAVRLAKDPERLRRLRGSLRAKLGGGTPEEAHEAAQSLEVVYRELWRHHAEGIPMPLPPARRQEITTLWAGSDRKLAVSLRDGEHFRLGVVEGGRTRNLIGAFGGDQVTPAFSPDGRRLAFSEFDGCAFQIVVADLASGEVAPLTGGPGDKLMPCWSDAGTGLAWQCAPLAEMAHGNDCEIWLHEEGGEPRRLTFNDRMDCYPAFARDGSGIIFESGRTDGFFGLFHVDWQGRETPLLHSPDTSANGIPAVGDDFVVFERAELPAENDYFLARLDLASGEVSRIADWTLAGNPSPRLSPDRQWVAAARPHPRRARSVAIHVGRPDGSGQTEVYGGCGEKLALPRWSRDSEWIAAEDRNLGTVVVIERATGRVGQLSPAQGTRGQRFLEIWNFDIH